VQATKRVPRRAAALGDYVVQPLGLPARPGAERGDEDYDDVPAVGGWSAPPKQEAPSFAAAAVAAAAAPRRAGTGSGTLLGGGGGGSAAALPPRPALRPASAAGGGGQWTDFSALLTDCVRDGLISEGAAAALRRLAYAGADVVRALYAEAEAGELGSADGQQRMAFVRRAQEKLEAAAAVEAAGG